MLLLETRIVAWPVPAFGQVGLFFKELSLMLKKLDGLKFGE